MEKVIDFSGMFLFLLTLSLLVSSSRRFRIYSFVLAGIAFFFIEFNRNNHVIIEPVIIESEIGIIIVRWVTLATIILLNLPIFAYFHKIMLNQRKSIELAQRERDFLVSQFVHDLRAPMHSIRGYSKILKDQIAGFDQEFDNIENLTRRVERDIDNLLVNNIPGDRIPEADEKTWVESTAYFNTIHQISHSTCQAKGIEFNFQITGSNDVQIQIDTYRVTSILENLIFNAIKFTEPYKAIKLIINITGVELIIKVSDQGIGIPFRKINELFEPYNKSIGSQVSGTGLGLTIAKKFVEQLGGSIKVNSVEGFGTTFLINLPIKTSTNEPPQFDLGNTLEMSMSNDLKAMVIDDDFMNAALLKRFLTDIGFNVKVCHLSREALESLKYFAPDVIFSDFHLPDEVPDMHFSILHSKCPNIPIVITTGSNLQLKNYKKYGIVEILTKGFLKSDVENLILLYCNNELRGKRASA
ncbi:hybrid sensor histidine kinase/response regulator [Chitinophaga caeni]|nr:hybrid sensor histidine kinase/response regulator [Chitinophaga caeni]